jgi:uncharacterized membrane protein
VIIVILGHLRNNNEELVNKPLELSFFDEVVHFFFGWSWGLSLLGYDFLRWLYYFITKCYGYVLKGLLYFFCAVGILIVLIGLVCVLVPVLTLDYLNGKSESKKKSDDSSKTDEQLMSFGGE